MGLTPDILLRAYAMGVFPMAESRQSAEIRWIDPVRRAVLPLDGFHVSRSLARHIRRTQPRVTLNQDFDAVLAACADRPETWINDEIAQAYRALHRMGHAHSVEVWDGTRLIGGTYGVSLGAAFFGESMFSRAVNGSKMALTYLVHHLAASGFQVLDVQFLTDHLQSLGAVEIPRATYRRRLVQAVATAAPIIWTDQPPEVVLASFGKSQPKTQTS